MSYEAQAAELGIVGHQWWPVVWRGSPALLEGRLDDARRCIEEAEATGQAAQGVGATVQTWFQRVALARATTGIGQNLVDEHDLFLQFSSDPDRYPGIAVWLCWQAGQVDVAAEQLAGLAPGYRAAPDGNWLLMAGMLAETAADIGDLVAARTLYRQLLPYSGHYMALGFGPTPFGSVDLVLGQCAAVLGDRLEAITHLENARAGFEERAATSWVEATRALLADLTRPDAGATRSDGVT